MFFESFRFSFLLLCEVYSATSVTEEADVRNTTKEEKIDTISILVEHKFCMHLKIMTYLWPIVPGMLTQGNVLSPSQLPTNLPTAIG